MIKFRQKDFSRNKLAGIIYKSKLAGDSIKKAVSGVKTVPRKSRYEMARDSIKTSRKIKFAVNNTAANPGQTVANAVGFTAENPIAGTVIATGYTIVPGLPGTTAAGVGLEGAAKKLPVYNNTTKYLGKAYKKSRLPKVIKMGTDAVVNSAKIMSGVPLS